MKVALENLLQKSLLPLLGACLLAGPIVGCGDASDPEAVSIDELKAPGNLWIRDGGNGSVTLFWNGSNFEKDFDGYNVYGMKDSGTLLDGGYAEGSSIKMLNEEGEPIEAAKTFIAKFNFDPAKPYEEAAAATDDDGEQKFSAKPVHAAGEEPIFPTCGHDSNETAAEGNCTMHSGNFARTTVGDDSTRGVAGQMGFKVDGLTEGSKYCFFVLASIDEGKKVSNSSTNIQCVTPRFRAEAAVLVPADGVYEKLDLVSTLKSCIEGTDGCGTVSATKNTEAGSANSNSPTALYFEKWSDGGITAGEYVGVTDLGYYQEGFQDDTLPTAAPAYTIGAAFDADNDAPLKSTGGYAPYGQTVALRQNHVYVIAVPAEATNTAAPTSFYYHWMYVGSKVTPGQSANIELRLSAKLDAR